MPIDLDIPLPTVSSLPFSFLHLLYAVVGVCVCLKRTNRVGEPYFMLLASTSCNRKRERRKGYFLYGVHLSSFSVARLLKRAV